MKSFFVDKKNRSVVNHIWFESQQLILVHFIEYIIYDIGLYEWIDWDTI